MAYTNEQIDKVCKDVTNALKNLANVNVQSYLSTSIIAGMKANKTADEIANKCYTAVKPITELNILQIVSGVIHEDFKQFEVEDNDNDNDNDDNDNEEES